LNESAGESATKVRLGALPFSHAGYKCPRQDSNLHLPLLRRSNPHLHHRPNLYCKTSFPKNSPGNLREEHRLEAGLTGNHEFWDDAPRSLRIPALPQISTSAGFATLLLSQVMLWFEVTLLFHHRRRLVYCLETSGSAGDSPAPHSIAARELGSRLRARTPALQRHATKLP